MEKPKAQAGSEKEMASAMLSLTALHGHLTRATKNLAATLSDASSTADAIAHAKSKLEKQLDKYIEAQMAAVELCADEDEVTLLDRRVDEGINAAEVQLRHAAQRNTITPSTSSSTVMTSVPKKVTFRPLDHDNVQLWMRQVEDVFDAMGITSQLNRFTSLTTLLNDSEANVIQTVTMADPRPPDVFDQAKRLLLARYERPVHERLSRAIAMAGFEADESPSQWLARFRQTRGECNIEDLDRWALIRRMPPSLHPTLEAMQPPPPLDEFVKHADRLIKTVSKQNLSISTIPDTTACATSSGEADVQAITANRKKKPKVNVMKHQSRQQNCVCWFHERFGNKAHTCEGNWCVGYKEGLTLRQHKRQGNDQGE